MFKFFGKKKPFKKPLKKKFKKVKVSGGHQSRPSRVESEAPSRPVAYEVPQQQQISQVPVVMVPQQIQQQVPVEQAPEREPQGQSPSMFKKFKKFKKFKG